MRVWFWRALREEECARRRRARHAPSCTPACAACARIAAKITSTAPACTILTLMLSVVEDRAVSALHATSCHTEATCVSALPPPQQHARSSSIASTERTQSGGGPGRRCGPSGPAAPGSSAGTRAPTPGCAAAGDCPCGAQRARSL
eukprot:3560536-Rhodomonas_salina.1